MAYKKIGVAGPVGSGKTALIEAVTREMASSYSIGVITNDIYTKEDAEFLAKNSVMPRDRITGVETGGCPHTAIFVIDVAEGDKIPRKGGPGITRSDLLVINKIELAPYVNASLEVMERDSKKMRGDKPFIFANVRSHEGVDKIINWIKSDVLLEDLK